jgi:hypothetical protein
MLTDSPIDRKLCPTARMQEQQVDVGVRRELLAAIPAEGDHADLRDLHRVGGIELRGGQLADLADHEVHDIAAALGDVAAAQAVAVPDAKPFRLELQEPLERLDLAGAAGQRLGRGEALVRVVQDPLLVERGLAAAEQALILWHDGALLSNGRTTPPGPGPRSPEAVTNNTNQMT